MKKLVDFFLFILGVLLIYYSLFDEIEKWVADFFLIGRLSIKDLNNVLLNEQEIILIDVLSDNFYNSWYENNLNIILNINRHDLSKYAHIESLSVQDTIPAMFRLVALSNPAPATLPALGHLDDMHSSKEDTGILFNAKSVPVVSTHDMSSLVSQEQCCKNSNTPNSILASNKHIGCGTDNGKGSTLFFFRGFMHYNWKDWFEIREFDLRKIQQSDVKFASYHHIYLRLKIDNKMLNDFHVVFADIGNDDIEDIILLKAPNNFSPYLSVHSATYNGYNQNATLDIEFEFYIKFKPGSKKIAKRLLEIEIKSNQLLYPEANVTGFINTDHMRSAKYKFSFNIDFNGLFAR